MTERRFFATLRHATASIRYIALAVLLTAAQVARADSPPSARRVFSSVLTTAEDIIQPDSDAVPTTLVATIKVARCDGLPKAALGVVAHIAYQAPDRLRISVDYDGQTYTAARMGNNLWVNEPSKNFAVLGRPGVPRFASDPASIDKTVLPPFALPLSRFRMKMASYAVETQSLRTERLDNLDCYGIKLRPRSAVNDLVDFHGFQAEIWVHSNDYLPARIVVFNDQGVNVQLDVTDARLVPAWPDDAWRLHATAAENVSIVAVSHLLRMLEIAPTMASEKAQPLPPADGKRYVLAREGKGRLEMIDGTRVLFLKGSPVEMGTQHGVLLREQVKAVCERILFGVGVGSSFARGSWFFGDIEAAEARLRPFMDARYLQEQDALANAAGIDQREARLANFFPELFHCTGFSIFGKATVDGKMYHGRVLDYLRGVGLEQNAVVIVHQPDFGYAWVNIGYAGFVGTVTAMNEKGISIGEMGGGGYGQWDGKPMAHLMREVMEKASTLEEAVKIMRQSPRTCQYYYVISDGKTRQAVGVAANPNEFATLAPGEFHPLLPLPQPDTVLLSAGHRYEALVERVKANYGHFDAQSALMLMEPPVCMESNIQSVLFEPETLDFWVANADSDHVASLARFTHYNLKDLLKEQ